MTKYILIKGRSYGIKPETQLKRFWAHVDKRGEDECWPWLGAKRDGYGIVMFRGIRSPATHAMWKITHGVYPDDDLCHTCDYPPCVNPKHLFEGTPSKNILDAVKKGRAVKYPQEVVDRIKLLATEGRSQADIYRITGVSQSQVSRIINNLRRYI